MVFCSLKQVLSESKIAWVTRIESRGDRHGSVVLGGQLCKMVIKIMRTFRNSVKMLATTCNRHGKVQESFSWYCSCHKGNESVAHHWLPQGLIARSLVIPEKYLYSSAVYLPKTMVNQMVDFKHYLFVCEIEYLIKIF